MNESDLQGMLQRATASPADSLPGSLREEIMRRVRTDDGRARRWRSFTLWLLAVGMATGLGTALIIGWSMASRDTAHSQPPRLELIQGGGVLK